MKNKLIYLFIMIVAALMAGTIVTEFIRPNKKIQNMPMPAQATPLKKNKIIITSPRPIIPTPSPQPALKEPVAPEKPAVIKPASDDVVIAKHEVNVEIADTDAAREQGLSGRTSLGENDGMLFIFPTPDIYAFWMKQMNFPLDFIWIYQNKVIEITPDAPIEPGVSDDNLRNYLPDNVVDSVLEVNAGWAARNDIRVGDTVVDQF